MSATVYPPPRTGERADAAHPGGPSDHGAAAPEPYAKRPVARIAIPVRRRGSSSPHVAAHAAGAWWRQFQKLYHWWCERRTYQALSELDDVVLKDIGVCRCEIYWLARERHAIRPSAQDDDRWQRQRGNFRVDR